MNTRRSQGRDLSSVRLSSHCSRARANMPRPNMSAMFPHSKLPWIVSLLDHKGCG